jgi:hypothetical protein
VNPDEYPRPIGGREHGPARAPGLALLAGAGGALVSLLLAALSGAPYLSLQEVNPWIVVFAICLFAALFAIPFVIERGMRESRPDSEKRWERALLQWGGITLALAAVAALIGAAGGFASDSLAGTFGLVVIGEAALVLGTLVVWILSG